MSNKGKIYLALIVLAVAAAIYLIRASSSGLFPFAVVTPTPTPIVNETASWKTYRNKKYGYEFKYPESVGVVSEYDGSFIGAPTNYEENLLLISDREKTFHFQINEAKVTVIKDSSLGQQVLSTFKFIGTPQIQVDSFSTCVEAGYSMPPSFPAKCVTPEGLIFTKYEACIQIIASARNPKTLEIRDFPTPCDVPEGWEKI